MIYATDGLLIRWSRVRIADGPPTKSIIYLRFLVTRKIDCGNFVVT